MEKDFLTVKKVALKNNCPECYNMEGLLLTFKQKVIETKFYKSITSKIEYEISCNICNTDIYPEQWTDDIERVVEYQKKAFTPKKVSTHLKNTSWILIIIAIILVVVLVLILTLPKL